MPDITRLITAIFSRLIPATRSERSLDELDAATARCAAVFMPQ